jgi:hypothetical protein
MRHSLLSIGKLCMARHLSSQLKQMPSNSIQTTRQSSLRRLQPSGKGWGGHKINQNDRQHPITRNIKTKEQWIRAAQHSWARGLADLPSLLRSGKPIMMDLVRKTPPRYFASGPRTLFGLLFLCFHTPSRGQGGCHCYCSERRQRLSLRNSAI